ncbi:MAG: integrase family protein [Thermoanaerobaculia bacterium]|nr:integrase family protein [Thermoanaerobaculia bacterium]
MGVVKLTEKAVEAANSKGRQQTFYWDSQTSGLGLRVTSTSRKAFVYRYSLDGRDRRITLGRWPEMTLEQAIAAAGGHRVKVQRGEDPRTKKETGSGDGGVLTLGDLWERYRDTYLYDTDTNDRGEVVSREAVRPENTVLANERLFERVILGTRKAERTTKKQGRPLLDGPPTPLTNIEWEDVRDWHRSWRATPFLANRALDSLRAAMRRAERWSGPWKSWRDHVRRNGNPSERHDAHDEADAGATLTLAELGIVGNVILTDPMPMRAAAFLVYCLTGVRPGEACRMRWEDLGDGERQGCIAMDGKTGRRWAALGDRVQRIIELLRPHANVTQAGDPVGWIFRGRLGDAPVGGLGKTHHGLLAPWKKARAAGITEKRLYDIRHTWISAGSAVDPPISDEVRRLISGHRVSGTQAKYLHVNRDHVPMASRIAEHLAGPLGADGIEERLRLQLGGSR